MARRPLLRWLAAGAAIAVVVALYVLWQRRPPASEAPTATAKSGCAGFSISQDVSDPATLRICEQWATQEDLDEHVQSADYQPHVARRWLGIDYVRVDGTILTKAVHLWQTLNGPMLTLGIPF